MHRFVSTGYVVVMGVAALGAALLAAVAPAGPFPLITLVLGIYALHLTAVHDVERRARSATSAPDPRPGNEEAEGEIRRIREVADGELREARRLREEAEQQWRLLRDMVQERVRRSGSVAAEPPAASGAPMQATSPGSTLGADPARPNGTRAAPGSATRDEGTGTGYGRW